MMDLYLIFASFFENLSSLTLLLFISEKIVSPGFFKNSNPTSLSLIFVDNNESLITTSKDTTPETAENSTNSAMFAYVKFSVPTNDKSVIIEVLRRSIKMMYKVIIHFSSFSL